MSVWLLCLSVSLIVSILPGTLCSSWTWLTIYFPILGKFSAIISSKTFGGTFSLSSRTPIIWMLVHLMLSQRSLRLSSFFFSFFFLYSVLQQWFPSFCLHGHLFILLPQFYSALIPFSVLFNSVFYELCLFMDITFLSFLGV